MTDEAAEAKKLTRDEIRAKLFAAKQPKSKIITMWDTQVEIRQPTLDEVLGAQEEPDRKKAVIGMMIRYAYVPGSDEKVFDIADMDAILSWPMGNELTLLNEAIEEMTGINVKAAKANLQ